MSFLCFAHSACRDSDDCDNWIHGPCAGFTFDWQLPEALYCTACTRRRAAPAPAAAASQKSVRSGGGGVSVRRGAIVSDSEESGGGEAAAELAAKVDDTDDIAIDPSEVNWVARSSPVIDLSRCVLSCAPCACVKVVRTLPRFLGVIAHTMRSDLARVV